jgi:hypothetical protein
MRSEF